MKKPNAFLERLPCVRMAFLVTNLILFPLSFTQAQWEWSFPKPQGNEIMKSLSQGSNAAVFASLGGGIMSTSNGGNNWDVTPYPGNLGATTITDLYFVRQQIGFAVGTTTDRNCFLIATSDGGVTWRNISPQTMRNAYAVFFLDDLLGWVAGDSLFRTTDGGTTWKGYPFGERIALDIHFFNSQIGLASTVNPAGIFKTTDGGQSWMIISSIQLSQLYMFDALIGFTIYGTEIRKTTDGGSTWLTTNAPSRPWKTLFVTNSGNEVRAIDDNCSTAKTTNSGSSWVWIREGGETRAMFCSFGDTSHIWATWLTRISYSTNAGISWQTVTADSVVFPHDCTFIDANVGWVVGGSERGFGKVMRTDNGGLTWFQQNLSTLQSQSFLSVDRITQRTLVACGTSGLIRKTTDGGLNWFQRDYGAQISLNSVAMLDTLNGLIVGENGAILKTSNGGDDWFTQASGTNNTLRKVKFIRHDAAYCAGDGIFLKSTDLGRSWFDPRLTPFNVIGLFDFIDENIGYAYSLQDSVWKTTDGGRLWSRIAVVHPYFGFTMSSMDFSSANVGWIGGGYGLIAATTNGGINWTIQNSRSGSIIERVYAVDNTKAWATTRNGILKTVTGGFVGVGEERTRAEEDHILWALKQNYPNPFNPLTTIAFHLPNADYVNLKVYDVLGKELLALVDEKKDAGNHQVKLDASRLSSGVYFYRLKAGSFVQTKKMLLVR